MSVANSFERQMLDLINAERTSRGIAPLTLELRLNDASEDHSAWMDDTLIFSHTGVGNSNPGDRMRDAGFVFSGSWTWGENIAWQSERGAPGISDDVVDLHNGLMNSPGHRANILNPDFEVIGLGIETGFNRGYEAVYVTQVFARTSAPLQLDIVNDDPPPPSSPLPPQDDPAPDEDLVGNNSDNRLEGGVGNDTLIGLGGDDTLRGESGADEIDAGDGADTVYAHGGDDDVNGGMGNDMLDAGKDADMVKGGVGNDTLIGASGNDTLSGGSGDDSLDGGSGKDRLRGGSGDDMIYGGRGSAKDTLLGGAGNDLLDGGNGKDKLFGEAGNDVLLGGGGEDVFVFTSGHDDVLDFDPSLARERIDLSETAAITSYWDLMNGGHIYQSGSATVIDDLDGNTMTLHDVAMDDLQSSDFIF
ncbi:CAP domain-containing protein [Roseovarius sp.]|uniref:CAP domain-containing protein n=1 Tax=Roseovarius sp. TaxID=1486281 RepID=UPI003D0DDF25